MYKNSLTTKPSKYNRFIIERSFFHLSFSRMLIKFTKCLSVSLFILLFFTQIGYSQSLTPSSLFTDHMVLQREMPVPIWGKAKAGEKITVTFDGQTKTTTTASNGKWMLKLDPLKASAKGKELIIKGSTSITIKDVLVGEVWLCSGQSNMVFPRTNVKELTPLHMNAVSSKMPLRTFRVIENIAFDPIDNAVGKWSTVPSESAVAFGFSYYLQQAIGVPVGIIRSCWGSSSIEGWMPIELTAKLPHFAKNMKEFKQKDHGRVTKLMKLMEGKPNAAQNIKGTDNIFVRTRPNILYNAMMHPLAPFAMRGMVWYQGEANSKTFADHMNYQKSLPIWLRSLRKLWGQDFHFMAVMLPGFGKIITKGSTEYDSPKVFSWSSFREAQLGVLKEPKTAVSNSIDLGLVGNIHPADKAPIGKRLSLLAQKNIYKNNIIAQGPTYKKFKIKKDKFIISFEHASGLKTKDGKAPSSFWLAGDDKKWYRANAKIENEEIVLSAKEVALPKACRYAFAAKPNVNLVNKAGLPAYPFRTDKWQLTKK